MSGERGYIVRFSNEAETKEPFVPIDVPERNCGAVSGRGQIDDQLLEVFGPRGARLSVPGYVP